MGISPLCRRQVPFLRTQTWCAYVSYTRALLATFPPACQEIVYRLEGFDATSWSVKLGNEALLAHAALFKEISGSPWDLSFQLFRSSICKRCVFLRILINRGRQARQESVGVGMGQMGLATRNRLAQILRVVENHAAP